MLLYLAQLVPSLILRASLKVTRKLPIALPKGLEHLHLWAHARRFAGRERVCAANPRVGV